MGKASGKEWCIRATKFMASFVLMIVFFIGGAGLVRRYELPNEIEAVEEYEALTADYKASQTYIESVLLPKLNNTDQESLLNYISLLTEYSSTKAVSLNSLRWEMTGSLFYTYQILSTIGYGNLTPETNEGKAITIFLCILGVPIFWGCILYFASLARHTFGCCITQENGQRTLRVVLLCISSILLIAATLLLSIAFDHENSSTENDWSYLDAVYFAVGSVFTVGLGDYVPDVFPASSSRVERVSYVFFSFFSVLCTGVIVNVLGSAAKRKAQQEGKDLAHLEKITIPKGRWQTVM